MRPLSLIVLLAGGAACASGPSPLTEAEETAIADSARALVNAAVANFDNLDMAAVTKDYSADPDARYMFNGSLYPSLAAYQKANEDLRGMLEYAHTTNDAMDAIVLGRDAVMLTIPWHSDMKAKGRPQYRVQGIWSILLQRRNGRWQVVHTHESLVNPEQTMVALTPPSPGPAPTPNR